MKTIKFAILALVVTGSLFSCKRGENDPGLTLKSRTARLTGEWTLSNVTGTTTSSYTSDNYTSTSTTTYSYANGAQTASTTSTVTMGGDSSTDTNSNTTSLTRTMTINKDGSYTSVETEDGDTSENTGEWMWLDQGKSKSSIIIDGNIYEIDQLKNKEMILKVSSSNKDTADGTIDESTSERFYTYTKN